MWVCPLLTLHTILTGEKAAAKNPTNPDSAQDSRASSTQLDTTLLAASNNVHNAMQTQLQPNLTNLGGTVNSVVSGGYGDSNYEVFDPLNWMLDGLVDFPYSYAAVQGLEGQGLT